MKRKILALGLSFVLTMSLIGACGKKSSDSPASESSSVSESSDESTNDSSAESSADPSSDSAKESEEDKNGDLQALLLKAKNAKVAEQKYTAVLPTGSEEAEIFIEPIKDFRTISTEELTFHP